MDENEHLSTTATSRQRRPNEAGLQLTLETVQRVPFAYGLGQRVAILPVQITVNAGRIRWRWGRAVPLSGGRGQAQRWFPEGDARSLGVDSCPPHDARVGHSSETLRDPRAALDGRGSTAMNGGPQGPIAPLPTPHHCRDWGGKEVFSRCLLCAGTGDLDDLPDMSGTLN